MQKRAVPVKLKCQKSWKFYKHISLHRVVQVFYQKEERKKCIRKYRKTSMCNTSNLYSIIHIYKSKKDALW